MTAVLREFPFNAGLGDSVVPLRLRRYLGESDGDNAGKAGAGRVVLMLHGGNTASDSFIVPHGGLAQHLWSRGCDVWLLDWRSSPFSVRQVLAQRPLGGSEAAERHAYTLDRAVEEDLLGAIAELRRHAPAAELALVGHCLGGGVISLAVARGRLAGLGVRSVVLSTLGLFYEVPWNGWIKAEDFLLERVIREPGWRAIDPHASDDWPGPFAEAFARWPRTWLPKGMRPEDRLLRSLSFMLGQPYAKAALHPSLRGSAVLKQFGPLHIGLYMHTAQNVRRGYAAPFGAPDIIDRPRERADCMAHVQHGRAPRPRPAGDLEPSHFAEPYVTLIGGAENQVWHRDAIDLMYDWLRSADLGGRRVRCTKRMFEGYRIQTLLWGANAAAAVYPAYCEGVLA